MFNAKRYEQWKNDQTCLGVSFLPVVHMTNGARDEGNPTEILNTFRVRPPVELQNPYEMTRESVGPIESLTLSYIEGKAGKSKIMCR